MPPQTRSKLQIQTPYPMGTPAINGGDSYEDPSSALHGKDVDDWDFRYGTPIRPPLPKRKCVSVGIQTEDIPEIVPALCRDSSSASTSPDPESDDDGSYLSKGGRKRKQSITSLPGSQPSKKAKPLSPVKLVAASPKQGRRESVTLDANGKPRSIYAPSPTPLQCSYVYPLALGPPRRPVDLRRAKGARIMPEVQLTPPPVAGENGEAPAPMDVDTTHKVTHRCPITFSREFEMRRHIRTVHIAEEIRAVVEGRLPREQATVIPENWDGKTLLSKPTCAGCGTTFSRPDAVRRHQTEVNARMENGICIECPGPKVHIRRGPRKDIFTTEPTPPAMVPAPVAPPAPVPVIASAPAPAPAPASVPIMTPVAPYPPAMMAAPALAYSLALPAAPAAIPAPAAAPVPAPAGILAPAPAPIESTLAPAVVAPPPADAAAPSIPTGTDSQPSKAAGERAEPAEGELESEDDM